MEAEGKKGPNKINVSSSSLVALKAELLSKQAQVQQAKAEGSGIIRSRPAKEKKPKPKSNTGVQERALRDEAQNITEMPTLEKSRVMLVEKAKLYETLSKDKSLLGEDTISEEQSFFLVNFQQKVVDDVIKKRREEQQSKSKKPAKKYESSSSSDEEVGEEADYPASNPDEEWVDYVDSFGRTRRCLRKDLPTFQRQDADLKKDENKATSSSASSYTNFIKSSEPSNFPEGPADEAEEARRARRLKWEEEEAENARKSKLHYQDILYQEARQHGVGFYSFSKDESERAKQMEELDYLRRQTETGRAAAVSAASSKRAALDARLKKVRERKRQKLGLPPLKEKPAPALQEEPLPAPTPPELASEEDQKKLTLTRGIPKTVKIRPWDIGKEGVPSIKRPAVVVPNAWVDKKREERPKEFAPPSAYDSSRTKKPENRKQQREPVPQTPDLTEESITAGLAFFKQMNSGHPARAPDPPEEEDDDDLYPPGMEDTRPPHRSGAAIPPPSSMDYFNSGGIGNRRGTAPPRADLAESFRQGLQNRRT